MTELTFDSLVINYETIFDDKHWLVRITCHRVEFQDPIAYSDTCESYDKVIVKIQLHADIALYFQGLSCEQKNIVSFIDTTNCLN